MQQDKRLLLIIKSQQMLTAAEASNWEQLASLEAEFQPLMREYFAEKEDAELGEQLFEQNQQIQALVKAAQKSLLAEQEKELSQVRAAENYLSNS